MSDLEAIKAPIRTELELFENKFRQSMKSAVPLLDRITHYVIKRKGKQMRPMFVFYSARMFGSIGEATYRGAALVELLHTATLVHDDVVDNAYERRGFFSINALWKNKIAVLVGDYLLARGLLLSLDNDDFKLLKIVSEAVKQMSEGELLQVEKARRMDISEDIYFEVIRQKTASLIASCCACGAASAGVDDKIAGRMGLFGEKVGMAFQIKDDLFDFGTDDVGKPRGIDIREKKITLPLIYSLNQAERSTRKHIIRLVKNHAEDNDKVREVIDFVKQSGGLEYAAGVMGRFQEEAFGILREFPDSESRDSLEKLVRFTTERKK